MESRIVPIAKPFHQMVWIDHEKATIFGVMRHGLDELAVIHAHDQSRGHVHHRADSPGSGRVPLSQAFLLRVTVALADAREILIVGPGEAKLALKAYIALYAPMLNKRILAVEPLDKCDMGELKAFATLFFKQTDRMRG